jgi:hypothetical protein
MVIPPDGAMVMIPTLFEPVLAEGRWPKGAGRTALTRKTDQTTVKVAF